MRLQNKALVLALWALGASAPTAQAQWAESFETYADGSLLDGQGEWHGWDGFDTRHAIITSAFASAGSQSLLVQAGTDSVREFDGIDTGRWTLSTEVYTPSSFVGRTYFLVLNSYRDFGPYQWSVQIAFDGDLGELETYLGAGTPTTAPLAFDRWTELRLEIDLDMDSVEVHYDGTNLGSYPWSAGPFGGSSFGLLQVDAVDWFVDVGGYPHTTPLFVDDMRLAPFQGSVGSGFCFGDGTANACPCGNFGATEEGCANGTGSGAKLSGFGSAVVPADDLLFSAEQLPVGQPALLFSGLNAVQTGLGATFGDGLRCAGGGVARLGVAPADTSGQASWGPGLGAAGGWVAGDTRRFQVWYRDPQGSPCGTSFNLSHGVEVVFVP